jgi:hypothetical protein
MEEMHMKKTLAILATVATVGATSLTAPAEARGIGPGLAFGLAAGAIAAGAAASAYPYYGPGCGPGYGYYDYGPSYYGPGRTPTTAGLTTVGTVIGTITGSR